MRVLARWALDRAAAKRWRLIDAVADAARTVPVPAVALTFDDGPMPGSTEQVLETLAELDVRATFFCVGRKAETHPALVRRIQAAGHGVGSHSFTHPDPQRTPLRELALDYERGRAALEDVLGCSVPLFRPPRGYLDLRRALQVRRRGLRPWLWSVDPQDWHPAARAAGIVDVAGGAGAGDVVLLHDWIEQPWAPAALDRSQTIDALPAVVAAIRARGLTLAKLG